MKIILCSANGAIRERWFSILAGQGYSLYQASSMQVLDSLIHKTEQYLLLVHQRFTDSQTIGTLCKKPVAIRIFFLSDNPNPAEGLILLQIGAVGYANTYIAEKRFVEAVKTVISGRVWFEQETIRQLIFQLNRGRTPEEKENIVSKILAVLSEREREIALLIVEGLSNKAIGEKLFISERTVKAHLGSIFHKTGAKSRLDLAMKIQRRQ
jgi:DNA-binding NarL/FixJ family response regulator